MHPPDQPSGSVPPERWAEYLDRYDRSLALIARSVEQGEEYHRLLRDDLRVREEAQAYQRRQFEHQQQQFEYQKRVGKWVLVVVALVLAGGVATGIVLDGRKKSVPAGVVAPTAAP